MVICKTPTKISKNYFEMTSRERDKDRCYIYMSIGFNSIISRNTLIIVMTWSEKQIQQMIAPVVDGTLQDHGML